MWKDISSYLARFTKIKPPKEFSKEVVQKGIQECAGINIPLTQIDLKKDTVFLKVSPLYKNEIGIHKEKILEYFKKEHIPVSRIL